jgi:magnesium chelatase family protein
MKTFHIWGGVIRGMISEVIRLEFSPADQQISAHLFASELEDEGHLAQLQARLAAHANVIPPPLTIQAMPLLEPGMKMSLDVPLTVGMLAATRVLASRLSLDASLWLGTIAPDGSLPPLRGVLPLVLAAREQGLSEAYVPAANALEAALVKGMTVYPLASLSQLVAHLRGEQIISPFSPIGLPAPPSEHDLATIRGQWHVKRAMEIAAAGGHHLLLRGAKGAGKTRLAMAFPSLLPPMTQDERVEVTFRYSLQGLLSPEFPVVTERPFRSLAPTTSLLQVVGESGWAGYGELAMAHRGVLLLDDLAAFKPEVLQEISVALYHRSIISWDGRKLRPVSIPTQVQLVASVFPCPCGLFRTPGKRCTCSAEQRLQYGSRVLGPLWPSIDLAVDVSSQENQMGQTTLPEESSLQVRARVQAARAIQWQRFAGTGLACNAEMGQAEVEQHCVLEQSGQQLMNEAIRQLLLSSNEARKLLTVARTIADLDGRPSIAPQHLAEAILHRGQPSW